MATMHGILILVLASLYGTAAHLEARQNDGIPPLHFNSPQILFTCAPANFTWLYTGPPTPVFLSLSAVTPLSPDPSPSPPSLSIRPNNVGLSGATPHALPTGHSLRAIPGALIPPPTDIPINQNGTPATVEFFALSSLPAPQGFYIITASLPSLGISNISSDPFFVSTGSNTSCLQVQPAPSSSGNLDSAGTSTSTGTSSISSSTNIPLPVGGSSVNTKSNSGAIAGGVIGGIAMLGIVIGALLYLYSSRRKPTKSRALSDTHAAKGWGGLSSVDEAHFASNRESKASPTSPTGPGFASATKRDKHTSQPDSLVAISGLSSMAASPSPSPLPAHYMEAPTPEPSSYASTYGTSPLAAATASELEYTSQTTHTGYTSHKSPFDSSSSNEDITSTPPSAYVSAAPGAYEMKRRPSTSSAASTTPTNGTNGKKRTPRKPVPVYTPSSSSPPPTSPPPVSPGAPSPRSPPAAGFDHDEELEERARGVLAHKNSFGLLGGEVHYLIPDMPVGAPQGR